MSFDVTPLAPQGRQIVQSYKADGFCVSGTDYKGPLLVLADETRAWTGRTAKDISATDILDVLPTDARPRILLIGHGERFSPPPKGLKADLSAQGVVLDWMTTKAACHTHNVLIGEDRDVATILFPTG